MQTCDGLDGWIGSSLERQVSWSLCFPYPVPSKNRKEGQLVNRWQCDGAQALFVCTGYRTEVKDSLSVLIPQASFCSTIC